MRRVIFTESQINKILTLESAYPLDLKGDNGQPEYNGNEVFANDPDPRFDDEKPHNVSTSEKFKRCKKGWYMRSTLANQCKLEEGEELDNMKSSGYGIKNDAFINSVAKNGGGKMVQNVNAEIKSNTDGSKNNTNQVRILRLNRQKKTNPTAFMKNGGEKTLSILKNEVKSKGAQHKAQTSGLPRKTDNTPNANKHEGSHSKQGPYYFM